MPTAVVTGANSGIGHAFAQLLIKEGYDVHAVDVTLGDKIKALQCEKSQVDVTSPDSIQSFKQQYGDKPLDLLLNIAGILVEGTDSLEMIDLPTLQKTYAVNTFGPLLLAKALLPNVLASKSPKLGFVSSRVGSIADNSTGGAYAYRSSKTALNSICKNLSVELQDKGVPVLILHPGIVNTGLLPKSTPPAEAVEPEEAAEKLWKNIVSTKGMESTGTFWHREGYELPW